MHSNVIGFTYNNLVSPIISFFVSGALNCSIRLPKVSFDTDVKGMWTIPSPSSLNKKLFYLNVFNIYLISYPYLYIATIGDPIWRSHWMTPLFLSKVTKFPDELSVKCARSEKGKTQINIINPKTFSMNVIANHIQAQHLQPPYWMSNHRMKYSTSCPLLWNHTSWCCTQSDRLECWLASYLDTDLLDLQHNHWRI